ncbi:MAG: nitrate reductase [Gammaproteobacteria bacterium HGW-Gammaproteobacteria-10]|nr:MAG: nitrate reductase [Gammaproteobacteria bacterium HGW-Gammaproteobacteria-3]PKM35288.1 MAG: nitrate reductase [Gammaproteobacteria bacterium HGW-Gammaproteobacteria-10]
MKVNTVKTTCPYCGVGCGIEARIDDAATHKLTIQGDPHHPANFGKLCSKGAALGDTVSLENRLLYPEVNGLETDWNTALDTVAEGLSAIIEQHGPDAVAFYVSGQMLTEDYYVANKLMKGFIGAANIDTNSRLCMSSAVVGYKRAFGADAVPCNYEDLELADLIILVGANAAWCHPILFQRIRKAKAANPALKIVVIDPRITASCDIADLHLPIKPGMDAVLFNGLLTYLADRHALDTAYIEAHTEGFAETLAAARSSAPTLAAVAASCALSIADVEQFYKWFATTSKALTVYSQGINQSSSGSDKCSAIINCHLASGKIAYPGAGPFSFTGQPNAMGGREVGGMANMLAAHMDLENPEHVERVGRFWGTSRVASQTGLKAVDMFNAIDAGKIKAVWIMATNPVVTLPDADRYREALKKCPLVIVSDCIKTTDTVDLAHVKLPATGWSEKDGTVTNIERRISRQRPLFEASGAARPDWWIISQVAARMGFAEAFGYQTSAAIFKEHAALSGFENDETHGFRDFDIGSFADIDQRGFDNLQPVQWPLPHGQTQGTARLFGDGRYYTPSQKARFITVTPRPPRNAPCADYPFTLNTGRLRDQWHTMTRTALSAKLNAHRPEPWVEIHPRDAEKTGLQHRTLATITSRWGSMIARVDCSLSQQPGSLFVPMHWSGQMSSQGRVGAVVNPVVDPDSGQPESKQTPVRIAPFQARWHAMVLSKTPLYFERPDYFVSLKGKNFIRYELAGLSQPSDWRQWTRNLLLGPQTEASEWLEYTDTQAGFYRAAHMADEQLQSCCFISPAAQLPDPAWLSTLFAQTISRAQRLSLLSGLPPKGQPDAGRIVCACFNVGEKSIEQAVKDHKLHSVEQIGQVLNAGTGCGSCLAELKGFLPVSVSS